jgi:hypothetical protein
MHILPPAQAQLVQSAAHFASIPGIVEALIQNALDAGALRIEVALGTPAQDPSGWSVACFDDGRGWSAADAPLLGMRGATSRAADRAGRSLYLLRGVCSTFSADSRRAGDAARGLPGWAATGVRAGGIFGCTPVRLAALVPARELMGVLAVVQTLAIFAWTVALRVDVDSGPSPLLQLVAAHTPLQRVAALFPGARGLRPVAATSGAYTVTGYAAAAGEGVGAPLAAVTLNGLVARGGVGGVREAAEAAAPPGAGGVHYLLQVTALPGSCTAVFDAAPDRAFVSFEDARAVRALVTAAVRAAQGVGGAAAPPAPTSPRRERLPPPPPAPPPPLLLSPYFSRAADAPTPLLSPPRPLPHALLPALAAEAAVARRVDAPMPALRGCARRSAAAAAAAAAPPAPVAVTRAELAGASVVGQFGRAFILLAHARAGVLIVDQHAAHERVRLEALEAELLASPGAVERVPLTPHVGLALTPAQRHAARGHGALLDAWGWALQLGERCEALLAAPRVAGATLLADPLSEFLDALGARGGAPAAAVAADPAAVRAAAWRAGARPPAVLRLLNSRACRGSVMFGDALSRAQCEGLVAALAVTSLPMQCAHGRPSVLPLFRLREGGLDGV